jgi:hypothetical protein
MFEDKEEILSQIAALAAELRTRLDGMDARLSRIEAELSSSSVPSPAPTPLAPVSNGHLAAAPAPPAPSAPSAPVHTVEVTINPLHDVSRVRVVEAAFDDIEGVESASLQTLSGNTAHLQVRAREDVPLISGLRRTLQLAFDVSESDGSSFTIALPQPGAEREGGVAARDAR